MERKWDRVARKAFLNTSFINSSFPSLPPVDVLLLSGVSLRQYRVTLQDYPSSLILSTSRLSDSFLVRFHAFGDFHIPIHEVVLMVIGTYTLYTMFL